MNELTYVESVKQERVISKPPSCSSCPLYNELQLYNLEPTRKCDVLILAPSPTPIVSWALDKANKRQSLAYIDTPFSEKSESVVKSAVLKFKEKHEFLGNINFWYGVQCRCWKPSKESMDKCSSFLSAYLDVAHPKVIVTLVA